MLRLLVCLGLLSFVTAPLLGADRDRDRDDRRVERRDRDKQVSDRPAGREIQRAAEKATFLKQNSIENKYDRKNSIRFTPADVHGVRLQDFADGQILGRLNIDRPQPGDRTALPPGAYNVYVNRVGGKWMVYFERGGKIVKDAVNVEFKDEVAREPSFKEHSDCILYSHWHFCY